MKVFFDTSSLLKLYHKEAGTEELIHFLGSNQIETIYLAEITRLEFCSAVWKTCRKSEITHETALSVIERFDKDSANFTFVTDDIMLRTSAKHLLDKY